MILSWLKANIANAYWLKTKQIMYTFTLQSIENKQVENFVYDAMRR